MAQPLITQFYNKRKRAAEGLATNFKSKVLVLDGESKLPRTSDLWLQEGGRQSETRAIAYHIEEKRVDDGSCKLPALTSCMVRTGESSKSSDRNCKNLTRTARRKVVPQTNKSDIRLAFKPKSNSLCVTSEKSVEVLDVKSDENIGEKVITNKNDTSNSGNRVVFELLGGLSPKKKYDHASPIKHETTDGNEVTINARRELGLLTPKKIIEQKAKALCLDEIRTKLTRSSRLAEIRESIKKFNKSDQLLKGLEVQKKTLERTSPRLQTFTSIDLEVPVSPQKASAFASPAKGSPLKKTPIKSPLTSPVKAPAYQRLAHLVQPGIPSLVLPYTYRILAEIFRCMDTVTSMMYNRKERVTFDKLKSGVQQMLRRNFTELHMGQIKKVFPDSFMFFQEKCSTIMSSKKSNKYQMVIMPIIDPEKDVSRIINGSCHSVMTPSLLVERRERFHKKLLEIVKDHHEVFLKNLDPPVFIPRETLARWHPDFDLDRVTPVTPAELPVPPSEEKLCSAQDVLDRAKTLFGCNQRMEKALQMVSEQMKISEETNTSQVTSNSSDSNSSLLRGIPKALLEKVRAKQAAKALLAMTRTPAEDREAMQLLRLPEIARVLRNIFVAEKKSVLPLEVTLEKLSSSYREGLSCGELEQHIRLLMKVVPGWVDILHVRKKDYVKVAKDADMSAVMRKVEGLAAEKNLKV